MTAQLRGEPCDARTRAGGRCRKLVVGGGPCRSHGGNAPQIRRARERRIKYAQALAADPRRSHAEVLDDVAHEADWLLRTARAEVRDQRPTSDTLERLISLAERAGQWARYGLDAGTTERQTRVLEAQAVVLVAVFERALDRVGLQPAQLEAAKEALAEELELASEQEA